MFGGRGAEPPTCAGSGPCDYRLSSVPWKAAALSWRTFSVCPASPIFPAPFWVLLAPFSLTFSESQLTLGFNLEIWWWNKRDHISFSQSYIFRAQLSRPTEIKQEEIWGYGQIPPSSLLVGKEPSENLVSEPRLVGWMLCAGVLLVDRLRGELFPGCEWSSL